MRRLCLPLQLLLTLVVSLEEELRPPENISMGLLGTGGLAGREELLREGPASEEPSLLVEEVLLFSCGDCIGGTAHPFSPLLLQGGNPHIEKFFKGTVSRELRWVLLYINQKLFSWAIVAHQKILILIKGYFTT